MPSSPHRRTLFALAFACGCYKQEELTESWQLDRLRILAVRAEPAEPQPGETVSFSALLYPPVDEGRITVWFACLPENADDFGCELDPALAEDLEGLDPSTMTDEELAALAAAAEEAGLIGVEPYYSPSWTAPEDALLGLDGNAALEGVNAIATLQAIPADASDFEAAYKRVPVSLATTPNHNPDLSGWTIDGEPTEDGATVSVGAGGELTLDLNFGENAIEDYTYLDDDGVEDARTEEPYFTFSAEAGEFDHTAALYPSTQVVWTAPEAPGDVIINVVMRDRRGGMDWMTLTASVQ